MITRFLDFPFIFATEYIFADVSCFLGDRSAPTILPKRKTTAQERDSSISCSLVTPTMFSFVSENKD